MKVRRTPLGFMAGRDKAQSGPASRLGRREILLVGGCASNLSPPRDERHLMLVFHDGIIPNRTFIIASTQVFVQPPFGVSAATAARLSRSDHEHEDQRRCLIDYRQQPVRHCDADNRRGVFVLIEHEALTRLP